MSEELGSLRMADLKAAMSLVEQIARMLPAAYDSDAPLVLNALIAKAKAIAGGRQSPTQTCAQCREELPCHHYAIIGPLGSNIGRSWICAECAVDLRRVSCTLEPIL